MSTVTDAPAMAAPVPRAPSLTKGDRTRVRILAAAAEHFAEAGLDAGSVPEIARRIGMSHAALYRHFGRKDELFRAAVEADLTALFDTVAPTLDGDELDPEGIVGLVPALAVASRSHPLARRVLAGIDAEQTEVLRDLPALVGLERRLVGAMAAAQRRGTVRDDLDATELAAGLIGVALPMLVVGLRLEPMTDIPRAGGALHYLAATLRPPGATTSRPGTSPSRAPSKPGVLLKRGAASNPGGPSPQPPTKPTKRSRSTA